MTVTLLGKRVFADHIMLISERLNAFLPDWEQGELFLSINLDSQCSKTRQANKGHKGLKGRKKTIYLQMM